MGTNLNSGTKMDKETPQRRPNSGYNERVSSGRYKLNQLNEK